MSRIPRARPPLLADTGFADAVLADTVLADAVFVGHA
jgi:hypothetical protein